MSILDSLKNLFARPTKKKATSKRRKPARKKAKKAAPSDVTGDISLAPKKKTRQKVKPVSSAPVDESTLGFSISIKNEDSWSQKRNALRIQVDGLKVFIPRLKKVFPVVDISATGLGFKFAKPRIKGGVKLKVDLVLKGKKEVSGILCKVMRHEKGLVGCCFVDLDRQQDDVVNRLVLLGQKQQSERRSSQKAKDIGKSV